MSKKTAKEVVMENLPDLEVVSPPAPPAAAADSAERASHSGPSMADLRKKYLGAKAEDRGDAHAAANSGIEDESDVEVVQVRPRQTPADPADDPGPRAVIISKRKGIIGSQG